MPGWRYIFSTMSLTLVSSLFYLPLQGVGNAVLSFVLQDVVTSVNTKCVECMCLMTLIQEHISNKHSNPGQSCLYFELSEWQQAGYKQKIKWALECDRCDFKTTNKSVMFEHIANHQVLYMYIYCYNLVGIYLLWVNTHCWQGRLQTSVRVNVGCRFAFWECQVHLYDLTKVLHFYWIEF